MIKLRFSRSFFLFLLLSSCARFDPQIRKDNASQFALDRGFQSERYVTDTFELLGYSRLRIDKSSELVIYIEGDGLAFRRKNQPSTDPTPIDFFTLQLAANDPSSSVVYLARPCQFLSKDDLAGCDRKYWTSHRYSSEVIQSYNSVIDQIKQKGIYKRLRLIGYSGGGTIAALIAAQREDVASFVTIAANLDLDAWTDHHGLSPMHNSLNPQDYRQRLETIPQLHLVGAEDEIVPPLVVRSYLAKMRRTKDIQLKIVPGFDHRCCWLEQWPALIQKIPKQ